MSFTVLFVDDEPDLQPLLTMKYRKELASSTWRFLFAQNGLDALKILSTSTDVKLLITDINMPDMDGHTLIKQARLLYPQLHVAILSAYDREGTRTFQDQGHPIPFIPKPLDFTVLTQLIHTAQEHKDDFDNVQTRGI